MRLCLGRLRDHSWGRFGVQARWKSTGRPEINGQWASFSELRGLRDCYSPALSAGNKRNTGGGASRWGMGELNEWEWLGEEGFAIEIRWE